MIRTQYTTIYHNTIASYYNNNMIHYNTSQYDSKTANVIARDYDNNAAHYATIRHIMIRIHHAPIQYNMMARQSIQ